MGRVVHQVTIPVSGTESGAFSVGGGRIAGIIMPAAGYVAGDIRFQVRTGAATWATIVGADGVEIAAVAPANGEYVALNAEVLTGLDQVRLKTTAAQTGGPLTFGVVVVT